jgi:hypothetical protein
VLLPPLERPAFWIAVPSAAWAVAAKGVRVPIGVLDVEMDVRKVEGPERVVDVLMSFAVLEAAAPEDANGSAEAVSRLEILSVDGVVCADSFVPGLLVAEADESLADVFAAAESLLAVEEPVNFASAASVTELDVFTALSDEIVLLASSPF